MNVEDLRKVVKSYNAEEERISDRAAEKIMYQIHQELDRLYNSDRWAANLSFKTFGFALTGLTENFECQEVSGGWGLIEGEEYIRDYELLPFEEFLNEIPEELKNLNRSIQIGYFQDRDIVKLRPLVKAFERKGLKVYADPDNYDLVVAFEL